MVYFISDLHLGHSNCLAYDNRPFKTVEDQDKFIIEEWNKTVKPTDEVWILGDISWYNPQKTVEIYSQLNGIKNLCIGNHDKRLLKNKKVYDLFNEITDYKELSIPEVQGKVVLCHYPIPCFNGHFHGWIHLHGHVHSSFEWNMMENFKSQMVALYEKPCEMFNVGCMMDYMNYRPRTIQEIISKRGIDAK